MPANTGRAGAIHRVACFAGTPAPTRMCACTRSLQSACPTMTMRSIPI